LQSHGRIDRGSHFLHFSYLGLYNLML